MHFFSSISSDGLPLTIAGRIAATGHRATTVCHLVNICRKLDRKLQWDPKAETFLNDQAANALISRPRRKGYELPNVS